MPVAKEAGKSWLKAKYHKLKKHSPPKQAKQCTYGITESQLNILGKIADALRGLEEAL
jgi:hypothetical protein